MQGLDWDFGGLGDRFVRSSVEFWGKEGGVTLGELLCICVAVGICANKGRDVFRESATFEDRVAARCWSFGTMQSTRESYTADGQLTVCLEDSFLPPPRSPSSPSRRTQGRRFWPSVGHVPSGGTGVFQRRRQCCLE